MIEGVCLLMVGNCFSLSLETLRNLNCFTNAASSWRNKTKLCRTPSASWKPGKLPLRQSGLRRCAAEGPCLQAPLGGLWRLCHPKGGSGNQPGPEPASCHKAEWVYPDSAAWWNQRALLVYCGHNSNVIRNSWAKSWWMLLQSFFLNCAICLQQMKKKFSRMKTENCRQNCKRWRCLGKTRKTTKTKPVSHFMSVFLSQPLWASLALTPAV